MPKVNTPMAPVYSINKDFYNVKDYFGTAPAQGDGITDDTAAITAAITAANAAGGGIVFFPEGTYISGNQTIYPNVTYQGTGRASIVQLKNGANTDLFSSQTSQINLAAAQNTGIIGTLYNFAFQDIVLDGNKANQTSGPCYPLRVYGYGYTLQNLVVRNGFSGGILSDWNGGANNPGNDSSLSFISNVKSHDNSGMAMEFGGPHDAIFNNIEAFLSTGCGIHFAPNMTGCKVSNVHVWAITGTNSCGWLIEAGGTRANSVVSEAANTQAIVVLGNDTQISGRSFGTTGNFAASNGLQIGQAAGNTPFTGQILVSTGVTTAVATGGYMLDFDLTRCEGPNTAINFANDGGNGFIQATIFFTAGNAILGTPSQNSNMWVIANGVASDGTVFKGGEFMISINATHAIRVNPRGNDVFNVDSFNKKTSLVNGMYLLGFSDNYITQQFSLNADNHGSFVSLGNVSTGQSATTPDPGNGGTIATANIGVARVTPTASETGIILAVGTVAGQQCSVINNSASFSITFAASGTSHVAKGTSLVIAALGKYDFTWDSVQSLWF